MPFGKDNIKQVTYSPGKIAKKMGISRDTLLKHLKVTKLIDQCIYDDNGWIRVPYDIVMQVAGPDILQSNQTRQQRKQKAKKPAHILLPGAQEKITPTEIKEKEIEKPPQAVKDQAPYRQLSQALVQAGITVKDLMEKWQLEQKTKEGKNNESRPQNNSP